LRDETDHAIVSFITQLMDHAADRSGRMFRGLAGRHQASTLVVTCLGFFMVLLDVSIVTVALPTIQASLQASLSDLQWVVDAYNLPFAVLLLTAGTLGDRYGRKRLFLVGLSVFTLGSAVCGLAPDLRWLVLGRALQGAGGAALAPGSLSLLASAFTDPRQRTQVVGVWAGISGIAIAAGSVVGGVLVQLAGWPAIFLVNLPIGVVALALGVATLAESRNPTARRADLPGQLLAVAGLFALTYALIEGNGRGWGSPLIVGLLAAAAALLAGFVAVEARAREPMLPLTLFASAVFSGANASALINGFALLGTVFFSAQYFQAIQGIDALRAGLRSLPLTLGLFLAAPVAGRVAARYGFRPPVFAGAVSAAAGLLLLATITPTTGYGDLWWKLALVGLGFGVMAPPLTSAVLTATPPNRAGLASSTVNASRQVGTVFGVALLGALVQQAFAGNLATRLAARGVPAGQAAALAGRLARAGSQAAQGSASGAPLDAAVLRPLVAGAFTDALRVAYVAAGLAVVVVAALALTLLGRRPVEVPQSSPTRLPVLPAEVAEAA
jgi:DHA2 family methylenomycin A resistance protein-like MFS transporter